MKTLIGNKPQQFEEQFYFQVDMVRFLEKIDGWGAIIHKVKRLTSNGGTVFQGYSVIYEHESEIEYDN